MTLPSRHRIRNSSPGGLRPSTLPLGHGGSPQYWLSNVDGEETFLVSFKPPRPGTEPRTLAWKAAGQTTTLGPPPTNVLYLLGIAAGLVLLIYAYMPTPNQCLLNVGQYPFSPSQYFMLPVPACWQYMMLWTTADADQTLASTVTQYWLMFGQRRRRWANISLALDQHLVFDHLQDRERWREMNGRQTHSTD